MNCRVGVGEGGYWRRKGRGFVPYSQRYGDCTCRVLYNRTLGRGETMRFLQMKNSVTRENVVLCNLTFVEINNSRLSTVPAAISVYLTAARVEAVKSKTVGEGVGELTNNCNGDNLCTICISHATCHEGRGPGYLVHFTLPQPDYQASASLQRKRERAGLGGAMIDPAVSHSASLRSAPSILCLSRLVRSVFCCLVVQAS